MIFDPIFLFFVKIFLFDTFFLPLASFCCLKPGLIYDTFAIQNGIWMDNGSVKKNISRIRKASGISQTEMAERLGISRTAYRNLESGDTKLISENVDRIAAVLEKTPEELVLGYAPSARDSMRVNDIQKENAQRQKELVARYDSEIKRLQEQIRTLRECIDALQETVRTKDEVILMLKRKIGGDSRNK